MISNTDQVRVPDTGTADLRLQKPASSYALHNGNPLAFTITVYNKGPNAAMNVTVKDQLHVGLSYVSDDSNGKYNPATGIWTVGTIEVDQSGLPWGWHG